MNCLGFAFACAFCVATSSPAKNVEVQSVTNFVAHFKDSYGRVNSSRLKLALGVADRIHFEECKADISLIGNGRNAISLLALSDLWDSLWQFFVFVPEQNGKWKFCGKIDFQNEHYERPSHRLERIGSRQWLVFGHIDTWGTGTKIRKEIWIPFDKNVGKPELSYLLDAELADFSQSIKFLSYKLNEVSLGLSNNIPKVLVSYSRVQESATTNKDARTVERSTIQTTFLWSDNARRFRVASPLSDRLLTP